MPNVAGGTAAWGHTEIETRGTPSPKRKAPVRRPSPTLRHACVTRRELYKSCQGRMMQSSIISCSCDGIAGGFSTWGHSTLLAVDSVRVPPLECGSSPEYPCHAPTQRL